VETVIRQFNPFLKTLETVIQKSNIFLKPWRLSAISDTRSLNPGDCHPKAEYALKSLETVIQRFLQPRRQSSQNHHFLKILATVSTTGRYEIKGRATRGGHLAILDPSDGKHASPAHTHAQHEHETKPKPFSQLGSAKAYFPSTSDSVGTARVFPRRSPAFPRVFPRYCMGLP